MRAIHAALVLLSFSAGAADAFAFLALGGIFTANMTGNLILTGMFTRPEFGATLVGAIVAIVAFAALLPGAGLVFALPALIAISALASQQSEYDLKALLVE